MIMILMTAQRRSCVDGFVNSNLCISITNFVLLSAQLPFYPSCVPIFSLHTENNGSVVHNDASCLPDNADSLVRVATLVYFVSYFTKFSKISTYRLLKMKNFPKYAILMAQRMVKGCICVCENVVLVTKRLLTSEFYRQTRQRI